MKKMYLRLILKLWLKLKESDFAAVDLLRQD